MRCDWRGALLWRMLEVVVGTARSSQLHEMYACSTLAKIYAEVAWAVCSFTRWEVP